MLKLWLPLVVMVLDLSACTSTKPMTEILVFPETQSLQDASNQETWYQAEWIWPERSVAFLSMLRSQNDGQTILVATSLTGQELFAIQQKGQTLTVLQQQPETKRLPLHYVYRDVVWATTSAQAFTNMDATGQHFQANSQTKVWQKQGKTIWQAILQDDGSWLVSNIIAAYQLRLSPLTLNEEFHE